MNKNLNNNAEHDVSPDERKKRDGQRRGKTARLHIIYGVKALFRKPWKITFIVLLGTAFIFCWLKRNFLLSHIPIDFSVLPDMLAKTAIYSFYALIIIVFLLLLALLLYVLGVPRKLRKVNRTVVDIFKNDVGYGYWPVYLSCYRERNMDLWRYEFYSEYVPLEVWETKSARLVNMLGGYIESISNGGKKENDVRYIIVYAGKGAKLQEREAPKDPLFRK